MARTKARPTTAVQSSPLSGSRANIKVIGAMTESSVTRTRISLLTRLAGRSGCEKAYS